MRRLTVVTGFAFSLLAYGAVSSIQMGDPARQQGVVSFRVKDPNQCTVTAYQDATLLTKVDDTNNTVFAGSESCARAYNIITGNQVTAVIGRRTSEQGSDGKLHSRSLEVSRTYYVVITDLTDSSSATVSFSTANVPWGDTHVEVVPYSDTGYNHWAYPDLDWSDQGEKKWSVDPVSGVGVKRITRETYGYGGSNGYSLQQELPVGTGVSSTWANPANAVNASASGPFASYAGTSQGTMFMPFKFDFGNGVGGYYSDYGPHLEDLRLNLYGYGVDTGNIEDRKVLVCLATQYNPATDLCTSPEAEVTLPATAGEIQFPTTFPQYRFAGWNVAKTLTQDDVGIATSNNWGGAKVVNSAVALSNNMALPPYAAAGQKINIGGTWYTIASITDSVTFTLVEPGVNVNTGGTYCGASSSACWYLGSLGFRVRKKTAVNNQINVAASYSMAYANGTAMPPNGVPDFCNALTFPVTYAADGVTRLSTPKTGRMCYDKGFLFMLADDGETRYISHLDHQDACGSGANITIPYRPFSATDPFTIVAQYTDDTQTIPCSNPAHSSLYEVKYDAAACHFKALDEGYNYASRPNDCMTWMNKMKHSEGKSIQDQTMPLLNANPLWDASFATSSLPGLKDVSGKWANLAIGLFQQNAPCFIIPIDLTTYTVTKIMEPLTGTTVPGFKWGGCHGVGVTVPPNSEYGAWSIDNLNWNSYAAGPYMNPPVIAKSLDHGATWNSDTSLATGAWINYATSAGKCGPSPWMSKDGTQCIDLTNAATSCGTNPYGVTGYQCIMLKMHGDQPCNMGPNDLEKSKFPCSWHSGWAYGPGGMKLEVGDYFMPVTDNGGGNYDMNGKVEKFRILSRSALDGSGNYTMEVQRWAACDNPTSDPNGTPAACTYFEHTTSGTGAHPNGWPSIATATGAGATTMLWVNMPGPSTSWQQDTSDLTVGHNTFALAPDGVQMAQIGGSQARFGTLPGMVTQNPQINWSGDSNSFNGITRGSGGQVESYPSSGNWAVTTVQQRALMWDFRHINPDAGTNPEDAIGIWNHTFALVSGQKFTYQMDIYQDTGDFKSRPVNVFSTRSAFKDISGPGSVIDDTKPWSYCRAYVAGECRSGSAKGNLYVSAPNAAISHNNCITDSYKIYAPCATPLWSHAAWMTEHDVTRNDPLGIVFRRITMGLTGPAAQYQYTSPHMTPDGKFAMVRAGYLNGVKADMVLVRMPPPAAEDSIDRSTFVPVPVRLPGGSNYARVRFGYIENGTANQFYCTSRHEACLTDASVAPFVFEQSDTLTAADCRNGCTINIPALSGRVVYYRVEKSKDGSTGWSSGLTQVKAVK